MSLFYLYGYFVCMYICTQERTSDPIGLQLYRWLWVTMQLLGREPRTSGGAASVYQWAISPVTPHPLVTKPKAQELRKKLIMGGSKITLLVDIAQLADGFCSSHRLSQHCRHSGACERLQSQLLGGGGRDQELKVIFSLIESLTLVCDTWDPVSKNKCTRQIDIDMNNLH